MFVDFVIVTIGELYCGKRLSVIKAHPEHITTTMNDISHEPYITITTPKHGNNCQRGMINSFEYFIIIVRNPYNSIWSEFQRIYSGRHHTGTVLASKFHLEVWKSMSLDFARNYVKDWNKMFNGIVINNNNNQILSNNKYLIIKYEDMLNETVRYDIMERIVLFTNNSYHHNRTICAFQLSDTTISHRNNTNENNLYATIDYAYSLTSIICNMWEIFIDGTNILEFGYTPWNNMDCSNII